jgi:DNA-binding transcriptional LysR family regulator
MSDVITWIRTFVRVVEAGSFTSVADERNTSQPTISRQVAQLEDHLGSLLFQRSTRALTLTDDGQLFYDHALRTLESLSEAEAAVGRRSGAPSGKLRINCNSGLARLCIVPQMQGFMERYPEIEVEFVISDHQLDIVSERIDLAIHGGAVQDKSLISRRIGTLDLHVVAAPSYLEKHGRPSKPQDLSQHNCILFSEVPPVWTFQSPDGPLSIPVKGKISFNHTDAMREAVLFGFGIGFLPLWRLNGDVKTTSPLEILLPEWKAAPIPINVTYSSRRFLSPKVRLAIDYLAGEFDRNPMLSSRLDS